MDNPRPKGVVERFAISKKLSGKIILRGKQKMYQNVLMRLIC